MIANEYKNNESFSALDVVRRKADQAKKSQKNQHYTLNKKNAFIYRAIFVLIGVTMAFLAYLTSARSPDWINDIYFTYCLLVKSALASTASLLAVGAIVIAWFIRPETESLTHVYTHFTRKLRKEFRRKIHLTGYTPFHHQAELDEKLVELRSEYRQAKQILAYHKDHTKELVHEIAGNSSYDSEYKEQLFNEALQELHLELEGVLKEYVQPVA